jgi:hypothetical protein
MPIRVGKVTAFAQWILASQPQCLGNFTSDISHLRNKNNPLLASYWEVWWGKNLVGRASDPPLLDCTFLPWESHESSEAARLSKKNVEFGIRNAGNNFEKSRVGCLFPG